MAQMMSSLSRYEYGSPPQEDRIKQLEDRVKQLEDMVEKLTISKKPSFTDFHFIKQEEKKKEEQELERRTMLARMNAMFR